MLISQWQNMSSWKFSPRDVWYANTLYFCDGSVPTIIINLMISAVIIQATIGLIPSISGNQQIKWIPIHGYHQRHHCREKKARLRHSVIISNLTTLLVSGNIQDMYKRPKNNTISDDVKDWPPSFIVIIWFIINSALLWGPSKWKSTTFNLISYCCQISGTYLKLWFPGLRRFLWQI